MSESNSIFCFCDPIGWQRWTMQVAVVHLFLVCAFTASLVVHADQLEQDDKLARMPVSYQQGMVVLVSRDGAAALRFFEPFERSNESKNGIVGVSYEWRYLERKPGAVEQTGKGRVFAKLVNGAVDHGSFQIGCGPIEIRWNYINNNSGSVHIDPNVIAAHPVSANLFSEQKPLDVNSFEPVDLSCFLFEDRSSKKEHRVSGPVMYQNCTLIAKAADGIATFTFGRTFERQEDANQKHYGVSYQFTFKSLDGKTETSGDGEVYELYKDNRYNGGRLNLEAGIIQFEWSRGGDTSGWVYYDPTSIRIWNVDSAHAASVIQSIAIPKSVP